MVKILTFEMLDLESFGNCELLGGPAASPEKAAAVSGEVSDAVVR